MQPESKIYARKPKANKAKNTEKLAKIKCFSVEFDHGCRTLAGFDFRRESGSRCKMVGYAGCPARRPFSRHIRLQLVGMIGKNRMAIRN